MKKLFKRFASSNSVGKRPARLSNLKSKGESHIDVRPITVLCLPSESTSLPKEKEKALLRKAGKMKYIYISSQDSSAVIESKILRTFPALLKIVFVTATCSGDLFDCTTPPPRYTSWCGDTVMKIICTGYLLLRDSQVLKSTTTSFATPPTTSSSVINNPITNLHVSGQSVASSNTNISDSAGKQYFSVKGTPKLIGKLLTQFLKITMKV